MILYGYNLNQTINHSNSATTIATERELQNLEAPAPRLQLPTGGALGADGQFGSGHLGTTCCGNGPPVFLERVNRLVDWDSYGKSTMFHRFCYFCVSQL